MWNMKKVCYLSASAMVFHYCESKTECPAEFAKVSRLFDFSDKYQMLEAIRYFFCHVLYIYLELMYVYWFKCHIFLSEMKI